MITSAEVKRSAREVGVDPMIIDRDHALGVILRALSTSAARRDWVFKGGTCLRKAYFVNYRFSEDLDFTLVVPSSESEMNRALDEIAGNCAELGLALDLAAADRRPLGQEGDGSAEIRMPYRGALDRGGSLPKIQFHLTADESLSFAPVERPLLHAYSDADELACTIVCYSSEEIATEKLRALAGQRAHAVARDLYDLWQLTSRGLDEDAVLAALPAKAALRAVALDRSVEHLRERREALLASWNRTLDYLVPTMESDAFDRAFREATRLLARVG